MSAFICSWRKERGHHCIAFKPQPVGRRRYVIRRDRVPSPSHCTSASFQTHVGAPRAICLIANLDVRANVCKRLISCGIARLPAGHFDAPVRSACVWSHFSETPGWSKLVFLLSGTTRSFPRICTFGEFLHRSASGPRCRHRVCATGCTLDLRCGLLGLRCTAGCSAGCREHFEPWVYFAA